MTKKYTVEELNKEFPGWRTSRGSSGSVASSPRPVAAGSPRPSRTADPAAERLAAFLGLLKPLLDMGLDVRLEHRFHAKRKWRLDLAIPSLMIAVEIEGGMYVRGGGAHQRVGRFKSDMEKYNAATELGWKLFRIGWEHVLNKEALALIVGEVERSKCHD